MAGTPGTIYIQNGSSLVPYASGTIVRIFDVHLRSGATASNLQMLTDSGALTMLTIGGTANIGVSESFCEGFRFESGLRLITDANFSSVAITLETEL